MSYFLRCGVAQGGGALYNSMKGEPQHQYEGFNKMDGNLRILFGTRGFC